MEYKTLLQLSSSFVKIINLGSFMSSQEQPWEEYTQVMAQLAVVLLHTDARQQRHWEVNWDFNRRIPWHLRTKKFTVQWTKDVNGPQANSLYHNKLTTGLFQTSFWPSACKILTLLLKIKCNWFQLKSKNNLKVDLEEHDSPEIAWTWNI